MANVHESGIQPWHHLADFTNEDVADGKVAVDLLVVYFRQFASF